ncbi:bifunctional tetrahydrofolate synthase/dihydrofolate synthase [Microbulbifer flavimaris]|uniref:Dihydrofolate synthase/folylpolyglutamate synthase n=1 Tax=Microbulbifer flavimaris TaxID=1781068 RepID=A0ABX4I3H0_9GAMM|nr:MULTISPECIES: bifunctional tetrahydrofolate synthase/dihydrofolate synthase [Microbulbifer]KUJ84242.1 bifunctional folylpolyglutamate synthase/ dihydrofolate synthase [Microbulbifer sp. ZGT114]PCO06318.1 bifunctional tetrahydrofolate synthase/dihydrofolate synthase [Microbulbifer flavimaris]
MSELQTWLERLERLHPTEIELGLSRVAAVADTLGVQKPAPKVITVAGTNGKGSCVATMEALLLAGDRRVGAYSSPHLLRFNERIRIDGQEASDAALVEAFEAVEAARGATSLTYFEFTTLAALWLFQRAGVEFALLEVGLGGRLDAVNLVDADIAVITSVAIDHEAWLGSDREVIGREKAGILRPGSPFVCADPEPPLSVSSAAASLGAPSQFIGRDFTVEGDRYRFGELEVRLPPVSLPRPSIAGAITALSLLEGLPAGGAEGIRAAIERIQLPGRCQQLTWRGRELLLDVGHNPAAAAYLARWLADHPVSGKTIALVAAMGDKDLEGLFRPLVGQVVHWQPAALPGNDRAADPQKLRDALRQVGVPPTAVDSRSPAVAEGAAALVADMGQEDRLLVFGSFFTVAEVLQRVREHGDGESEK